MGNTSFIKNKIASRKTSFKREIESINSQLLALKKTQETLLDKIQQESNLNGVDIVNSEVAYPEPALLLIQARENAWIRFDECVPMVVVQDVISTKIPVVNKCFVSVES